LNKPKILIQLDTDPHPSVFDGVVAVDAGVEHLFQYGGIKPEDVRSLVHGAMFTRGPADLKSTAVFVGGSDVQAGREVAEAARLACFDPFRVSIMQDCNGSNSTAAAAVLCANKHVDFTQLTTLVLAATGAVGQTVAKLVAGLGGRVILSSRKLQRSAELCQSLAKQKVRADLLEAVGTDQPDSLRNVLTGIGIVFGCGAAGVELLGSNDLQLAEKLRVAVDLNAVPPAGIAGIGVTDHAMVRGERVDYGALGVGGLKMKIHKASIRQLFVENHHFIDAFEMMEIGRSLMQS
jgi:methylenetetrahydrofolate/methylenetetrahydromethanopterin dehydrogenase (NADP+)